MIIQAKVNTRYRNLKQQEPSGNNSQVKVQWDTIPLTKLENILKTKIPSANEGVVYIGKDI